MHAVSAHMLLEPAFFQLNDGQMRISVKFNNDHVKSSVEYFFILGNILIYKAVADFCLDITAHETVVEF